MQGRDIACKEEGRAADGFQAVRQSDGSSLGVEIEGLGSNCRHAVGLALIADGRRNGDLCHGGIGAAVVLGLVVLRQEQDRIRAGDLPPQAVLGREDLAEILALAKVALRGNTLTDRDHAVGGQPGEGRGRDADGAVGHARDLTLFVDGRDGLIGGGPLESDILHGGGIDLVGELLRLTDADLSRLDLDALRAISMKVVEVLFAAVAEHDADAAGVGGLQGQLLNEIRDIEDDTDGLAFLHVLEFLGGFQIEELLCGIDDPEELEILVVGDGDSQLEVAVFVLEQLGTLQLRFRVIDIEGVALIVVPRQSRRRGRGRRRCTHPRAPSRRHYSCRPHPGRRPFQPFCTRVAVA